MTYLKRPCRYDDRGSKLLLFQRDSVGALDGKIRSNFQNTFMMLYRKYMESWAWCLWHGLRNFRHRDYVMRTMEITFITDYNHHPLPTH
jgi:hypothetical protein